MSLEEEYYTKYDGFLTEFNIFLKTSIANFSLFRNNSLEFNKELKSIFQDFYKFIKSTPIFKNSVSYTNNQLDSEVNIPFGFYVEYIPGDGTCGFHAISSILNHLSIFNGFDLRENILEKIKNLKPNNKFFHNKNDLRSIVGNVKRGNICGENKYLEQLSIRFIAYKYNINIFIYNKQGNYWLKFGEKNNGKINNSKPIVYLINEGIHFNLLKPICNYNLNIKENILNQKTKNEFIYLQTILNFLEKYKIIKEEFDTLKSNNVRENRFLPIFKRIEDLIPTLNEIAKSLKTEIAEYLQNPSGGASFGGGGGGRIIPRPPPAPRRNTKITIEAIKNQLQLFYESILENLNGKTSIEVLFKLCYYIRLLECLSNPPHNIKTLDIEMEFYENMNADKLLVILENYFSKF